MTKDTKLTIWTIILATFLFAALLTPLFADDSDDCQMGHEQCGHMDDTAVSDIDVVVTNTNEGSSATAEGGSASASADVNISSRKQAPSFGVGGVYSSNPCVIGKSGVISVPGLGIGAGGQKTDSNCEDREVARLLYSFGERDLAIELLCMSESGQKLGDKCKASLLSNDGEAKDTTDSGPKGLNRGSTAYYEYQEEQTKIAVDRANTAEAIALSVASSYEELVVRQQRASSSRAARSNAVQQNEEYFNAKYEELLSMGDVSALVITQAEDSDE